MISLWIVCALFVLVLYLVYRSLWNPHVQKLVNRIPGPKTYFLLGNLPDVWVKREDLFLVFSKIQDDYKEYPFMRFWAAWDARIFVQKAQAAEAILSSNQLIDKGNSYKFVHPWLGLGLLTSTGSKWHSRRKLLTPTFHFKILEEFFPIIVEQSQILLDVLKRDINTLGNTLNIYPYLARCALDIICETAMGKNIKAQYDDQSTYVKAVNDMGELFHERMLRPWLNNEFLFDLSSFGNRQRRNLDLLHQFTDQVIRERRKEKQNAANVQVADDNQGLGIKRRLAFLDLLLESNLEDKEIREEVDTFMFEGHDTTSSGINWVLFNVGKYPDIQTKVRQELSSVLQDDFEKQLTTDDLKQLKYLECVIKESMRLFPPVPYYGRVFKQDTTICGYEIPAGVEVTFSPYIIHRDPEFFKDPNVFQPERWIDPDLKNPFAYVPFSAGPRNCIGQKFAMMEEKVVVVEILRNYWIQTATKEEELGLLAEFILRPKDGMKLTFENKPIGKS